MEVDETINEICRHGENSVVIKVPFILYSGIEVPARESNTYRVFNFKTMTLKDSIELDRLSYVIKNTNTLFDGSGTDYNTYRYLMARRTLLSEGERVFERKNGWMDEADWNYVKSKPAPMLHYAVTLYEDTFTIPEDERNKISKEAALLFGSQSGKVYDPSPGISLTCTLESLWDKFGLTKLDVENMSLVDYSKIKLVLTKEAEKMKETKK